MSNATSTTPASKPATDWTHILIGGLTAVASVAVPSVIGYAQNLPWSTITPMFAPAIGAALTIINEFATTTVKAP